VCQGLVKVTRRELDILDETLNRSQFLERRWLWRGLVVSIGDVESMGTLSVETAETRLVQVHEERTLFRARWEFSEPQSLVVVKHFLLLGTPGVVCTKKCIDGAV